jgi:hypothetical protein
MERLYPENRSILQGIEEQSSTITKESLAKSSAELRSFISQSSNSSASQSLYSGMRIFIIFSFED